MAQTTVKTKLAFGVQGEFYDSSVKRVTPHVLAASAVIGSVAWVDAEGKAYATGGATGAKVAGIFVSPKEYVNRGAIDSVTLNMATGDVAQVADIGHVIVKVQNAVNVGDNVFFGATGWYGATGNTGPTSTTRLEGAKFVRVTSTATGDNNLAVIELNG